VAPDVTKIRPSGKVVAVGYHRRCAIRGTEVHDSVIGLKIAASLEPRTPPALSWPPTTRIRPSARAECPEQKTLYGAGADRTTPVIGSQMEAVVPPWFSPPYTRDKPEFGRRRPLTYR
jgi:hypothetical protein